MVLSLQQVRAFEAAADAGSFTAAAERLNLTQSAVSMLIRQMETVLGLPLFLRTGKGVTLTTFGKEARPRLNRALAELAEVEDAAQGLSDLRRGDLRFALPQILAAAWLPSALGAFSATYPDVRIEVADTVTDRVAAAVASNSAEIGLGPERIVPAEIEAVPVWDVPMKIALPAGASGTKEFPLIPEELNNLAWIHYSDELGGLLQATILGDRRRNTGADLRVRNLTTALALLPGGRHATIAPAYASVFGPLFGVAFRDLPGQPTLRRFMLYTRRDYPLSPAAAAFRDIILAQPPDGALRLG